jgi:hypothetical protein
MVGMETDAFQERIGRGGGGIDRKVKHADRSCFSWAENITEMGGKAFRD